MLNKLLQIIRTIKVTECGDFSTVNGNFDRALNHGKFTNNGLYNCTMVCTKAQWSVQLCSVVCTTKVTFLPLPIAQAGLQSNNFKYPTTQILPSASHCAKACYSQKCTSAAYQPLNSTSGSCLLTYQNLPECPSDDGGSAEKSIQRTDAYNGSEPIVLQCLKC
uniref:Apple domain-containing protein n=1 Tax=Romanomermis culicivorax TaxID=13658 RepID=A0A915KMR0_ROMCU